MSNLSESSGTVEEIEILPQRRSLIN